MTTSKITKRLSIELGFTSLFSASRDVHILLVTRFIRMFAYGSSTLILALYFAALGHSDTKIGLFMTLTLIGDVAISLALTLVADRMGRRRILLLGALLMVFSGTVFAIMSNYWAILFAAIVGVISPSGNEIGPFRAVEESTLAHLTEAETRSDIFALYVVVGTLGTAGGSIVAGYMTHTVQAGGWSDVASYRLVFWLYAGIGLIKVSMTMLLSQKCEVQPERMVIELPPDTREQSEENQPFLDRANEGDSRSPSKEPKTKPSWIQLSAASRRTLLRLCSLFLFDSLASGMVPASLIAYFMSRKFSISEGSLGTIIASAQFVSSLGNLLAASIAKRIGLVRTMVFTHLPSAIFLALLPAPMSLFMTIVLLVARSSLASMDQAPRSAFLSAVVLPEERTAIMGIVNTVKTMSQSAGPLITGALAADGHFWAAFVVAGGLKASYDIAMLSIFASTPLEGEQRRSSGDANAEESETRPSNENDRGI